VVIGYRELTDSGFREARRLDVAGLALGGGGLALALLGVSEGGGWGWRSTPTIAALGGGVVLLAAFVRHELRTTQPLIELRILRMGQVGLANAVTFFIVAAQYARLVFVPLALETLRGYSALRVGVLLTPAAVLSACGMPIAGRLVDSIGPRRPMIAGTSLMCVGAFLLGQIKPSTPDAMIVLGLAVQGLGFGLASLPALVVAVNKLEQRYVAQASTLRTLTSQVAGATSVAVLTAVVAIRMGSGTPSAEHQQAAYDTAFLAASIGMVIALLLALRVPKTWKTGAATGTRDLEPVLD
jgi:predicted MFS family arabinose efflux permease